MATGRCRRSEPLSERQVAALTRWVELERALAARTGSRRCSTRRRRVRSRRGHWAFQPLGEPAAADGPERRWVRTPVDRFILARLEAEGLSPSPRRGPADPDPPRDLRPDRAAADPGGGRGVRRGRFAGRLSEAGRPPARRRRTTASTGAGTGSTWPATPTPRATSIPGGAVLDPCAGPTATR